MTINNPSKRQTLRALPVAVVALLPPWRAAAHDFVGTLQRPIPVGDAQVTTHEGRTVPLRSLLLGRVTALQWMFTGCSSTCPIQGAIFAETHRQLRRRGWLRPVASTMPCQLLSLSVDVMGDTPHALQRWLARYREPDHAQNGWTAAVPKTTDIDALRRRLAGDNPLPTDRGDLHDTQVLCIDSQARVRWRSPPLPQVRLLVNTLGDLARTDGLNKPDGA